MTLLSWYVDFNTLLIWSNYSAASPKVAREEWTQFRCDFVKLYEWWYNYRVTFFSYSSASIFFILFVLHAIFFFRLEFAGNCFSKSPPPPPPSKVVKWSTLKGDVSAIKDYDNLWHDLWRTSFERPTPITLALRGHLLVPRGWHRLMEVQLYEIIVILIICVKL